jgi:hypothetical protein
MCDPSWTCPRPHEKNGWGPGGRGGKSADQLSHRGDGGNRRRRDAVDVHILLDLSAGILLRAIPRNMTGLAASVASLASSVQGTTVGSSAVAGNVAQLAAGIALHGLCLAITSKVVRATTLVASCRARTTGKATTTVATRETTSAHRSTTTHGTGTDGVGASTLSRESVLLNLGSDLFQSTHSQVTGLTAAVAAPAGASSAQAQGGAIGLNMTKPLAMVALLGLSGARQRAAVGLVAGLLAVVAKTLSGRAHLSVVANIAALVARATGERRHLE